MNERERACFGTLMRQCYNTVVVIIVVVVVVTKEKD
jgi:hypothetical protein